MRWWLVALAAVAAILVFAQDDPPAKLEFFSGFVKAVAEDRVVVSRTIAGRQPETREFLINEDTIIEGMLRPEVRVTVGFVSYEDGDYAARIIVRGENTRR